MVDVLSIVHRASARLFCLVVATPSKWFTLTFESLARIPGSTQMSCGQRDAPLGTVQVNVLMGTVSPIIC